jgi:hypothetical protein
VLQLADIAEQREESKNDDPVARGSDCWTLNLLTMNRKEKIEVGSKTTSRDANSTMWSRVIAVLKLGAPIQRSSPGKVDSRH